MASEMLERVADAIDPDIDMEPYLRLGKARAVIAAMREPTPAQISHATLSFPPWGGHGEGSAPSQADMWRAMIDGALKE